MCVQLYTLECTVLQTAVLNLVLISPRAARAVADISNHAYDSNDGAGGRTLVLNLNLVLLWP